MKSILHNLAGIAAMVAATACATSGGASPPRLDHEEGAAPPVFQPMLVVPLPPLHVQEAPEARAMDALQARATPVGDVLLALFKDSDINLVLDPSVQAVECTFDIKKSTVEEAFEALLESLDLGYEWDGSFLRVRNTVKDTILVDLMDRTAGDAGGAAGNSGSSGGGGSSGNAGASGSSGGGSANFWDEIEQKLPEVLGEGATYVLNRVASAIHVQARPSGVRRLREIVDTTLDRANRQVSLEARVLEVRLNRQHQMGINWSMLPGLFNSARTGLAEGGSFVSQTAASGGTAFKFGILDGGNWAVVVDALQSQGQVRVLSNPRVSTLNNQTATIGVTDQLPYIVRNIITTQGVAQTQYSVEFATAGVVLQVRPLIGEDGLLSVSITPSVREKIGTAVTPDGFVQVPVISERQTTTTVRVADGQAVALGGLRSTRKNETVQGIPFLMDIPWLGQLFSSTVQESDEVELMILLVPRVLDETWIAEEVARGSHRLVHLREEFQWNSIHLDGYRPEDWSGGSAQGQAQAAMSPDIRVPVPAPQPLPADRGTTVTRKGLAGHWLVRAEGLLAKNDPRGALKAIEQALALEPDRREALVAAGLLHQRYGDRSRARTLLDRAVDLGVDDVVTLTARGSLELDAGAAYAAKRYFLRAHEKAQSSMTAANLGAAMMLLGEAAEARELMRASADPMAPPELHANLAYAELANGHVEKARASLLRALAAGAESRNPRIVALERLIGDAEVKAAAATAAKP